MRILSSNAAQIAARDNDGPRHLRNQRPDRTARSAVRDQRSAQTSSRGDSVQISDRGRAMAHQAPGQPTTASNQAAKFGGASIQFSERSGVSFGTKG